MYILYNTYYNIYIYIYIMSKVLLMKNKQKHKQMETLSGEYLDAIYDSYTRI